MEKGRIINNKELKGFRNNILASVSSILKSKRYLMGGIVLLLVISFSSCSDYVDIVPDNVATIDNAFTLRNEAEKYLFTCYSFLPKNGDGWHNLGMMGGDEIFLPMATQSSWHPAYRIALGQQNTSEPLFNEWAGSHVQAFKGIRNCNIFIEKMKDENNAPDLDLNERTRWIAEVEFLKAYYHFYLFRMYGPIPIMDETPPIGKPTARRMPVDSVVNYISSTLDKSIVELPKIVESENTELGRVTKPIALAVKAQLWLFAASPLFNGNSDYSGFVDKEGTPLFNTTYDLTKWERARDAAKEAIESAESGNHSLYEYNRDVLNLSDTTKQKLSIRNAVTEPWNEGVVWGLSNSYFINQNLAMPPMIGGEITDRGVLRGIWSVPIKIAKKFYTKNGVPIGEDKTLDFNNYMSIRAADSTERYYIEPGYETARLNFDREPRFYADLGFDGSVWYMRDGSADKSDEDNYYVESKNTDRAGYGNFVSWNETGYFVKKLVNYKSSTAGSTGPSWVTYPWPEIRLADLYLMYAEALNEVEPASSLAIEYVDKVRNRAGLERIVESWTKYSTNPSKYTTQDGLRDIIRRERTIEMAFEGKRFWDLRRWKLAAEELNEDITGFNIKGKNAKTYNNETVVFDQDFIAPRDYLWPIGNYDMRRNPNLVENPGW